MIKKYIFSIILTLCLVVVLFPGTPVAAANYEHSCLCGNYNCHETGTGHGQIPANTN